MKKQAFNGFRIYRNEALPDFFTRLVTEQLNLCIDLCHGFAKNPDYAVHEIRKATKRIRSVYRLFQPGFETEAYENARRQFAGLSDLLAIARRNEVYRQSLALLSGDRRYKPVHLAAEKLTEEITKQHKTFIFNMIQQEHIPEQIVTILKKEKQLLRKTNLSHADLSLLYAGWKQTYRQGLNNLKVVMQHTNAITLHNLRKSVKMIWNQLLLFQPLWPAVLNGYISQFDRLAEKLGMDHDLAELEAFIKANTHILSPDETSNMLAVTAKKQQQIRQTAIPIATKLFAEKPGAFASRMAVYYNELAIRP
ncbi:MAG: CHAD domain-containing protein [Bacteroidales bacterium]|nr:CHAD domain-containing protein [Bacteroidales bacterium]